MNDWEKFLEKRKANIGFITRGRAFRDPTPAEMSVAIQTEIKSWQSTIGKSPYKLSAAYSISKGSGVNLLRTRECEEPIKGIEREKAIDSYIKTPMDEKGILREEGIDLEQFKWKEIGIIKAFFSWITGKKVRRKNDN